MDLSWCRSEKDSCPGGVTRSTAVRVRPGSRSILALVALVALGFSAAEAAEAAVPVPLGKAASAAPELAFETHALVASGLAPGAEVVFHGVGREHQAYFWRLVQTREPVMADATGTARLELPEEDRVPPRSLWTVVDPATGELAIGSPPGFTPEEIPFPARGLGESEAGAWRTLRTDFQAMEILYVRPGSGAWYLVAVEGSASDDDLQEDSTLTVRLEDAEVLWGSEPAPRGLAPGDLVVAVSLDTLQYFAARLVEPGSGQ